MCMILVDRYWLFNHALVAKGQAAKKFLQQKKKNRKSTGICAYRRKSSGFALKINERKRVLSLSPLCYCDGDDNEDDDLQMARGWVISHTLLATLCSTPISRWTRSRARSLYETYFSSPFLSLSIEIFVSSSSFFSHGANSPLVRLSSEYITTDAAERNKETFRKYMPPFV